MSITWYNEDRKKQFASGLNTLTMAKFVFNAAAKYEAANETDLGGMSGEMVQRFLNTKLGPSKSTTYSSLSFIRKYQAWCVDNGFEQEHDLSGVELDTSYAKRKAMVASPYHLEQVMNQAFSPVEENTTDCLYRCMLWMVFVGIDDEDAIEVKSSDVDLDSMCIFVGQEVYPIYRLGYKAFYSAKFSDSFYYYNSNYKDGGVDRARTKSDYLLRGVRVDKQKARMMLNSIRKRFSAIGMALTCNNVRLSGLYFRTLQQEQVTGVYNFDDEAMARAKKAGVDLSSKKGQMFLNKTKKLIDQEYQEWKIAFE